MVLLMAVSFSFAQMKNVKEAKSMANDVKPNFKQAEQLIKEAMKNPETKDLADTWDVAGFIQRRINEEQMKNAFLKKPYDTLKVYNSILKMYEYYTKCDELAEIPNEKGKVKNKYRKANASSMLAERPNLINGGIQYFNLDKNKEALKFFATYVESASYPMLADKELAKNDTLLPQIAYYATLAADRVGDKDAIIKAANNAKAVITIEEHSPFGGLGSMVSQVVASECPKKVINMALPDAPVITGTSKEVFDYYGLNAKGIVDKAVELVKNV